MTDASAPIVITIDNLANGGDGAGRLPDGRIVFVPRTVPGEEVEIELTRSKKAYAFGRLLRVVKPSPDRVEPDCPHFDRCGGCQFWHMNYRAELEAKAKAAAEAIARVGGIDDLPEPTLLDAPAMVDYRARATFHRRKSSERAGVLGFFAPGTNRVVDIAGCPIVDPLLNQARDLVAPAVRDLDSAEVFIETAGEGQVVITVTTKARKDAFERAAGRLADLVDGHELLRGAELLGPDERRLSFGEPVVDATEALVAGLRHFVVPAGHFRQANPAMNRKLVARVRERLAQFEGTRLLELFAGMGNFTLALAGDFERVWAVESDPGAVQTGRALAEADRLSHVYFQRYDLAGGVEEIWPGPDVDLVLLDPPRGGAADVCEGLATQEGLKAIVYVSCDAACLGRDLKTLATGGWRVRSLDFVDLFPRTTHVESIAVLTREAP